MKKFILLFILFILSDGCIFFESMNYTNCVYYEEDGLYYDTRNNEPCTSLNKKIERERKKLERESKKFEKNEK